MEKQAEQQQTTFQITGMTCAACANRIEKGLKKLEGVDDVNVNFALEKASITYNPKKVDVSVMEKKIDDLGYSTVKDEVDFHLVGMTCAACANRIEKGLNKLPGISSAVVNFALESAYVEFHSQEISITDMIKKVEQLGYQAIRKDQAAEEDFKTKEIRLKKIQLLVSACLSIPLLWAMVAHFSFTSWIYVPKVFMNPWLQLVLATPVQFIIGRQFYIGAFKALRNKSANMDVLVALGTSAAYFYSLYLTLNWASSEHALHAPDMYFETSAILITLIILGKLFESLAKGRTS